MTSRIIKSGRSLCHFDRLPCRCRYCYHYSVQLFRPYRLDRLLCLYRSNRPPPTDCYQPTATDRLPLPRFLLLKVLLPDVLLLTNSYRVLLLSVLPLTVLFYFTALSICFYYYFYYYYCYCCYCCCYYFWFTTVLITTSRKIGS